ncbi:hypothetical protein FS837_010733 [Tulasnella sp. UAMH 9824]|nr:hypothetical protein FS837_010733 [Tulasnella sp. UAMH 9824]
MAPIVVVARSLTSQSNTFSSKSGFKITSVSFLKTQPVTLLYSWTYERKSPPYFTVAVIKVGSDKITFLKTNLFTKGEGLTGELSTNIDISSLKGLSGKYVLAFVNSNDLKEVFAKSETFQIKKSYV